MSNVILFMSDEHNPRYSSVYGHPFVETPNMARLAEQGIIYDSAYCPSPLCLPSRAAIMAGKRVHTLQSYNNLILGRNSDHQSYGAALAAQGIHSVFIGKTDVYDVAENLCFSEMILPADRVALHREVGRNPLMCSKDAGSRADKYGPTANPWDQDLARTNAAVAWITERAPQLKQPWVLVINLIKPHFPHFTTQELWDRYDGKGDLPEHGLEAESAQHPYAQDQRYYFSAEGFTEEQIRGQRQGYYGCVTFVDEQLGRVMDALEVAGIADKTNVIYTSDHGEMLGKFGMWWKCSLYEDAARIPLIAAGPDFAAGERVQTPVDLFDVQATMFHATGAERPNDWVGQPLPKIVADDHTRVIFSEYHGHGTRASAFMVRQGDWKYIHYADGPHQLFHLADDPEELHNLYTVEPGRVQQLDVELRRICSPEVENERAEEFIHRQLQLVSEHDDLNNHSGV